MAVLAWPAQLPRMTLAGYGEAFADGRLKSKTDMGPGKIRRRFSAAPVRVTGQVVLSGDQPATLERFYNETTARGTKPFTMDNQRLSAATLFVTGSGVPVTTEAGLSVCIVSTWIVRFEEPPQFARSAFATVASLSLVILP